MPHNLENHFLGEESWIRCFNAHRQSWATCENKEELLESLSKHMDLCVVINGIVGPGSVAWTKKGIPALDGASPSECSTSERGIIRLKSMLMRM